MKKTKIIIRDYLQKAGRLDPVKLGPESNQRRPTKENLLLVGTALTQNMKNCNRVITTAIILLFLLVLLFVGVGVFTTFHGKAIVLLGGSFLSLAILIKKLLDSALEKSTIAATLAIINNQPPELQEKAIEALYWNLLKGNRKE